ncbi:MAG: hypothetical protein DRJ47_08125 [Thermoprotei archaeon]|nr:MAG: hypothetical protein DRJ47_08125 [Thermoprotei archaeon]
MRVLHIWNTAGVASILAKYQAKLLGWNTWVITRKAFDRLGLTTYGEAWDTSARKFYIKALLKASRYDIIHVHALDKIVPLLKLLYPRKSIILHYHGTDIRKRWNERKKYWKKADLLLVSTPDLLEGAPDIAIWLPNPIDTELFKPIPHIKRKPKTALYIYKGFHGETINEIKAVAQKFDLKLTIIYRDKKHVPHIDMPKLLNRFEYFIDRRYIHSLSKTALEALACRTKVITWDDRILTKLPEEHKPENVVNLLFKLMKEYLPL